MHLAVPLGLFNILYSNVKHIFPFEFKTGIFGVVINRSFTESNPQYFLDFKNPYIKFLLFSLQANMIGTDATSLSGILKFLLNLSNISSKRVLPDFSSNGYKNFYWNINRLEDPAHKNIKATVFRRYDTLALAQHEPACLNICLFFLCSETISIDYSCGASYDFFGLSLS